MPSSAQASPTAPPSHRRSEYTAAAARRDRERRGQDLQNRDHQEQTHASPTEQLAVERVLHDAVTVRHDRQRVLVIRGQVETDADDARQQRPESDDERSGSRDAREEALHSVEELRVEDHYRHEEQREQRVRPEFEDIPEDEFRGVELEQVAETELPAVDTVGQRTREDGRNENVGLELCLPVEDFRREQRAGERSPEDRADPRAHARGQ
jgi:hypothetical protein